MQPLPESSGEHSEFEELCRNVEEFEPLPDGFGQISARRFSPEPGADYETEAGTLDPLILAGLVSPV